MKFAALATLVATTNAAGTVAQYVVCTATTDCSTTDDKCGDAPKTGSDDAKICGPCGSTVTGSVVLASTVTTYGGFTFKCPVAVTTTGAKSLAAGAMALASAIYLSA